MWNPQIPFKSEELSFKINKATNKSRGKWELRAIEFLFPPFFNTQTLAQADFSNWFSLLGLFWGVTNVHSFQSIHSQWKINSSFCLIYLSVCIPLWRQIRGRQASALRVRTQKKKTFISWANCNDRVTKEAREVTWVSWENGEMTHILLDFGWIGPGCREQKVSDFKEGSFLALQFLDNETIV